MAVAETLLTRVDDCPSVATALQRYWKASRAYEAAADEATPHEQAAQQTVRDLLDGRITDVDLAAAQQAAAAGRQKELLWKAARDQAAKELQAAREQAGRDIIAQFRPRYAEAVKAVAVAMLALVDANREEIRIRDLLRDTGLPFTADIPVANLRRISFHEATSVLAPPDVQAWATEAAAAGYLAPELRRKFGV
jgi:hypothetical protein